MGAFDAENFFILHADLPREGPGETADVAWAAEVAGLEPAARICDAASGPGGDIGALLRAAPEGHVTAIDRHAPFIEAARARWGQHDRVTLRVGDYLDLPDRYDLIWCAGAVYFAGIETALTTWRGALTKGGVIAFSEPCLFSDSPSQGAVDFWQGHAPLTDARGIAARVTASGFETLATRRITDIGWESYFRPLLDRVATLRQGADPRLTAVLDEAETEARAWWAHRRETGYLLCVVRPA
ncbi:Methyltransferase type 12 [Roseibacterium elongatum DSM 19469]|uniref:Methyltransferase type 12 n=1 Tax=Roseicyclus elongatus DSM 19469 TaxID=1294273 RepID=W8RVM5_9RHOB|nr:class I SAM-dependent methyltransferase [Roseibacterium elongatum]AHM05338.1 Methyltransferase type 12 [Roseibacterium elongatum DSM 19469]